MYAPTYAGGLEPADSDTEMELGSFYLFHCEQMVTAKAVDDDVFIALLSSFVKPPNPAPAGIAKFSFVLDAFTDSSLFSERAKEFGWNVTKVPLIGYMEAPLPDGSARIDYAVPDANPAYKHSGVYWSTSGSWSETHGFYYASEAANKSSDIGLLQMAMTGQSARQSGGGDLEFGPTSYWRAQSDVPTYAGSTNREDGLAILLVAGAPSEHVAQS